MLIINAPSCDALWTCCLICKACGGLLIFHCILIQSLCLYVVWWFSLIAREFQLDLWAFPPGVDTAVRSTCWLCRSRHKWIIFYRAWRRLTGLIQSFSVCSLSSRLPPAHQTAPGLTMAFPGPALLLLRADAAFKVVPSLACLAVGMWWDKYPRLCRIYLPILILKGYFQAL